MGTTPPMAARAESLDDLPLPRRVAVVGLLGEALAAARELATLYAAFEARVEFAALAAGLGELARAKAAHVAALEPLARLPGLGAAMPAPTPAPRVEAGTAGRARVFTRAFEAERALGGTYRELLALLADHPLQGRLAGLAAEAARQRARLRELYLRYS